MLTIKLQRVGKKHQGSFRLIVGEKRHKLQGKQVEDLGWYNPRSDKMEVNKDRVAHWLKNGVQVTDSVHNILVTIGMLTGKKVAVHKQPKKKEGATAPIAPVATPAAQ